MRNILNKIILNLDPQFRRSMLYKDFSIFSFYGNFIQGSGLVRAILVVGITALIST